MLILTMRTDKPLAELGLYDDTTQVAYHTWEAHRQLAETIHAQIYQLLNSQSKTMADIQGIACYGGPGSFTGLRIGLSVANAIAYSLGVPIAGAEGEQWLERSLADLASGHGKTMIMPEYGAPVHITQPKH